MKHHALQLTGSVSGPRTYHTWSIFVDGKLVMTGAAYSAQLASLTMRAHAQRLAREQKLRVGRLKYGRINTR